MIETFAKRRWYVWPELWYRTVYPDMRYVRLGGPPDHWKFDRVRLVAWGLWRNVDEPRQSHHLLFRRVGE